MPDLADITAVDLVSAEVGDLSHGMAILNQLYCKGELNEYARLKTHGIQDATYSIYCTFFLFGRQKLERDQR